MAKLNKDKLLSLVSQEITNSLGFYGGDLSEHRRQGLKFYLGEPLGNEVEGQSQVVSQDLLETIETIMPSMMRIFTQGESIVRFEAQQPEDVEFADQATDYINHIFSKDNNGYQLLHTMFKDALISKNGFVKFYWKTSQEQKKESYSQLTEEEYQKLLLDEDIEIISLEEEQNDQGMTLYDVEVKRVKDIGRVCIENVPPENMMVSRYATSLDDCNFIAQRVYKTRSELVDMGFDRKIVEDLPPSDEEVYNDEAVTRKSYEDHTTDFNYQNIDPSMTTVLVTECYLKCDFDGDGIAELRKVTVGGNGYNNYQLLENEEIEQIPYAMSVATPMPHRFFGLSMYDLIGDIQEIKTTLLRQILNNAYLQNNSRLVVQDSMANIDDLLVSRPGGIVRVKSPDAVKPLATPNFINEGLAMIGKIDEIREARSGVSKVQMGLDADQINKSHTTAVSSNLMMNASTQRIEMIARNFADGVKKLFQGLLTLICTHQDHERIIKLRGKFVPINPREWVDRYNATVVVGLGTGSQDQRLDVLTRILNVQEKLISRGGMGLVDTQKIYNTIERYLENAGYKDANQFFNNPATQPPKQPMPKKPDPAMALAQQELMMKQAKERAELQLKAQKQQTDAQLKATKMRQDDQLKRERLDLDQQRLATEVIRDQNLESYQKEKLASQIVNEQNREQLENEKLAKDILRGK